ncbi:NepR family anti-sigma factor [Methylobacterium aerolatum]|uniref:NepR family anti-sigma factor n=1 Tax=Methylobacterium aerolatum TaxID=418708 RepID=UPI001EDE443C|nr:NepR family anti-sigma factor [Methylobacterium aerolatum]
MAHDDRTDDGTPARRAGSGPGRPPRRPSRRPIDATARARIGQELQRHYGHVLALPIPDHFRALLDDLAEGADRETSR